MTEEALRRDIINALIELREALRRVKRRPRVSP